MCCSPNREVVRAATHYQTFAKPQCDNVLQPEPRSGEGCNTFSQESLANVKIQKRMLYRHCYIPSFQAQAVPNNFIQLYAEMSTVWWQSKTSILSTNVDQKQLETDFSIARPATIGNQKHL